MLENPSNSAKKSVKEPVPPITISVYTTPLLGSSTDPERSWKKGCSNGSSVNWLKLERPKHAICPHQEDYCCTCAKAKETIRESKLLLIDWNRQLLLVQKTLLHLRLKYNYATQIWQHTKKPVSLIHIFWSAPRSVQHTKIAELEEKSTLTDDEMELKKRFKLVLSMDYQNLMAKLIPLWGALQRV